MNHNRIRHCDWRAAALLAPIALLCCLAHAQPNEPSTGVVPLSSSGIKPSIIKEVGIDQKLNGQVPLDLVFNDEHGKPIALRDCMHGRPVILTLVYYECPMLCTMALNDLVQAMNSMTINVGRDYDIITVSIDPNETPALAASKKAHYLNLYGRPGGSEGWHFLTGDQASIHKLADSVGFRYAWDPQHKQFVHASGIMVLTPDGKISRYFFGINYEATDLRLSLVEASHRKIGSLTDTILLYCCQYDPSTGKYTLIVGRALQIGGGLILVVLTAGLWLLFRSGPAPLPTSIAAPPSAGAGDDSSSRGAS